MSHNATLVYSWEIPEYIYKEKKIDWYWWIGAIALAGILVSILVWKNYIFAIFLFIAALVLGIQARRKPEILIFEISETGVTYGSNYISFNKLDAFWIESGTEERDPRLFFHSNTAYFPVDPVPIPPNIDISELRDYLLDYIEEHEMRESLLQKLAHRIGM